MEKSCNCTFQRVYKLRNCENWTEAFLLIVNLWQGCYSVAGKLKEDPCWRAIYSTISKRFVQNRKGLTKRSVTKKYSFLDIDVYQIL